MYITSLLNKVTTGVTSGTATANLSGAHQLTPGL